MDVIDIQNHVLKLAQCDMPTPAAHQVLIKVSAAGVNYPDIMQRKGLYPPPAGASPILGLEIAGTVAEVGTSVTNLAVGDRVCALVNGGGYAQYCLASACLCLPIPQNLTFIQAAALPETFFTVWSNLFDRGQLTAGETVLIHGGSGGIGTTAIQMANAFGANVFVTAGSDEKCQRCLELGASVAINYNQNDFSQVVLETTQNRGVDVILDIIGAAYFAQNIRSLAFEGRLILIALQQGLKTELNLLPVMLKRLTITGSTLRARDDQFKADIAAKLYQYVWPMLENGKITPFIHAVLPLKEAYYAHELIENRAHIGKIVLEIV
jgi:putative PIG3 family NAD(P)H quinone oxidoreductase